MPSTNLRLGRAGRPSLSASFPPAARPTATTQPTIGCVTAEALARFFGVVLPHVNEVQRRVVAGASAELLGRGGKTAVASASGMSRNTVIKAEAEVATGIEPSERLRAAGGGDKPLTDKQPGLLDALDKLVHPATRGNPMSLLRVPSRPGQVVVDCTAQGLATSPMTPIFAGDRITVQFTTLGVAPWSAAILGHVEAREAPDTEKNRLCPVVPRTGLIADQTRIMRAGFAAEGERCADPDLAAWSATARLNPARSIPDHLGDAEVVELVGRMMTALPAATENLTRLSGR